MPRVPGVITARARSVSSRDRVGVAHETTSNDRSRAREHVCAGAIERERDGGVRKRRRDW